MLILILTLVLEGNIFHISNSRLKSELLEHDLFSVGTIMGVGRTGVVVQLAPVTSEAFTKSTRRPSWERAWRPPLGTAHPHSKSWAQRADKLYDLLLQCGKNRHMAVSLDSLWTCSCV